MQQPSDRETIQEAVEDADREAMRRGEVILTEADWALLRDLGGERGQSRELRRMLQARRNARNYRRINAGRTRWQRAVAVSDAEGLTLSEYVSGLIDRDLNRLEGEGFVARAPQGGA